MRVTSFTSIIFLLTVTLISFQNCSHLSKNSLQATNQLDQSSLAQSEKNIFQINSKSDCTDSHPKKIYYEAYWLSRSENGLKLTQVPSMDAQIEHSKFLNHKKMEMKKISENEFAIEVPLSKAYCEVTGHIGSVSLEGSSFPFEIKNNQLTLQQNFSLQNAEFTSQWGEGVYIVISYYTPFYEGSDNSAFAHNPWFQKNENIRKLLSQNNSIAHIQ